MKIITVIGAGQLGSRHLQGLKRSNLSLNIWVVDTNELSLEIARKRYNELPDDSTKQVFYVQSIEELPSSIDVAIISTSSQPRAAILNDLLLRCQVSKVILEKFLFPKLSDYEIVENLLVQKRVAAWVNCPRRIRYCYQQIKTKIDANDRIEMSFRGKNWGICCNSIHFIDLFMFLTQEKTYEIDLSGLLPKILKSKRSGYIELCGELKVITPQGHILCLSSTEDFVGEHEYLLLSNGSTSFCIDEVNGLWGENGDMKSMNVVYQSETTGKIVDQIIESDSCGLPTYDESAVYHKLFLSEIMKFVNQLQGWESDSCPIT